MLRPCVTLLLVLSLISGSGCSEGGGGSSPIGEGVRRALANWGLIKPPERITPAQFAERLYEVSVYTGEGAALEQLLAAEVELVASRLLARQLISAGRVAPPRAPPSWDAMHAAFRDAIAPIAQQYAGELDGALRRAGLEDRSLHLRTYERLILAEKNRGVHFADGSDNEPATSQLEDIPQILEFHRLAAASKWRGLWPELRVYAARIAALHHRIDADPGLGPGPSQQRTAELAKRIGGRGVSDGEWRGMLNSRLGLTLSGMHRFDYPLGTRLYAEASAPAMIVRGGAGGGVTISSPSGGFVFRILDSSWDKDISRRLSPRELMQIDDALTASYDKRKRRWFAPLEVEFDAHVQIAQQRRGNREMQELARHFAEAASGATDRLWSSWL